MKIQLQEKVAPQRGGVVISPNMERVSVRVDKDGNEIDPRTKKIIKPAERE